MRRVASCHHCAPGDSCRVYLPLSAWEDVWEKKHLDRTRGREVSKTETVIEQFLFVLQESYQGTAFGFINSLLLFLSTSADCVSARLPLPILLPRGF
jgi:hypothetical protein